MFGGHVALVEETVVDFRRSVIDWIVNDVWVKASYKIGRKLLEYEDEAGCKNQNYYPSEGAEFAHRNGALFC